MGYLEKMTASRPVGGIRGKDRVNRPKNPKERGSNPMGQHGRNDNQQARGRNKK